MIQPVRIIEENEAEISIVWQDESETRFRAVELRRACPCAGCINEWTGEKMLDDAAVSDDISFNGISVVGRYALNFHFSDGHDSGIFSFEFLRNLANPSGSK